MTTVKIPGFEGRPLLSAIYADSMGNLLIPARAIGLYFYNLETGNYFLIKHNPDDPKSMTEGFIETIFEERKGLLWFGMNNSGINVFDYRDSSISRILVEEGQPYAKRVRSIVRDRQGRIWVGTRNGLYLKETLESGFYHYECIEAFMPATA